MWFASYLYENNVISGDQFAEAVRVQLARRPRLGTLVVRNGLMTIKQVMAVLSAQADRLDEPFGELAVEMGYLSREQLAQLLFEQADRAVPLGDILVESGAITREQYRRELREARTQTTKMDEAYCTPCVTQ